MATKLKATSYKMEIVSKPISLYLILLTFFLCSFIPMLTGGTIQFADAMIYYGVIAVFLLVVPVRRTTINRENAMMISKTSRLGITSNLVSGRFQNCELVRGTGGNYARGGSLVVNTTTGSFVIADSGIFGKSSKSNKFLVHKINKLMNVAFDA